MSDSFDSSFDSSFNWDTSAIQAMDIDLLLSSLPETYNDPNDMMNFGRIDAAVGSDATVAPESTKQCASEPTQPDISGEFLNATNAVVTNTNSSSSQSINTLLPVADFVFPGDQNKDSQCATEFFFPEHQTLEQKEQFKQPNSNQMSETVGQSKQTHMNQETQQKVYKAQEIESEKVIEDAPAAGTAEDVEEDDDMRSLFEEPTDQEGVSDSDCTDSFQLEWFFPPCATDSISNTNMMGLVPVAEFPMTSSPPIVVSQPISFPVQVSDKQMLQNIIQAQIQAGNQIAVMMKYLLEQNKLDVSSVMAQIMANGNVNIL